ncbi:hypothetical protein PYCC9005_005323 [Savitreella phatthalungensis]
MTTAPFCVRPRLSRRRSSCMSNTVLLTDLPSTVFDDTVAMRALRDTVTCAAGVAPVHWVPLRSFSRVVAVFGEAVRVGGLGGITAGVPAAAWAGSGKGLQPPEANRNWLISPPGSPPVGWHQVREDPPNAIATADDLATLLEIAGAAGEKRCLTLLEPEKETVAGAGLRPPGIVLHVDDGGDDRERGRGYGKVDTVRTAMPPK